MWLQLWLTRWLAVRGPVAATPQKHTATLSFVRFSLQFSELSTTIRKTANYQNGCTIAEKRRSCRSARAATGSLQLSISQCMHGGKGR